MGEDVAGVAVHIAARIGSLAEPGEVLASRTVKDLVAGGGFVFDSRGDHVATRDVGELGATRGDGRLTGRL